MARLPLVLRLAAVAACGVFVCPSFRREAERDPWAAESWIIHELLDTLGLGENPPSSREITQRVTERCQ